MPNKQAIIENVDLYSAAELVGFIRAGVVSFNELCEDTEGYFSASTRKEVEAMLKGSEADDWQKAKTSQSIDALEDYLSTYTHGSHREDARTMIRQLQAKEAEIVVNNAWDVVDKNDLHSLQKFCSNYPDDENHCREARKRINELKREEYLGYGVDQLVVSIKNIHTSTKDDDIYALIKTRYDDHKISREDLLEIIRRDHNIVKSTVVNRLLEAGLLEYEDFERIGIKRGFVKNLIKGVSFQIFSEAKKIDKINKQSTEVYFWGIPSSGKSCALGAILSVAGNGKVAKCMNKDNDCQGYGYMTRLSALFNADNTVCRLPEPNQVSSTYEMGFDLVDNEGLTHPITCVDLAGELVRCMYKSDAGENMSPQENNALNTLTHILIDNRSKNRKIHFFVLEYGAEDREYEGLPQSIYLDGALRYIERTGIFKNDTDAIYLIITKVDKIGKTGQQLKDELRNYVSNKYGGFYNGLVNICSSKNCEINNGIVEILPFTLGEVCFQDYCLFNDKPASNVVQKLIDRSKGFKNGRLQRIINTIKE